MSDLHPSEDQAALYVLGGLTAPERREFEAELVNSPELRALVRELEESAVLLARSSPRLRPSPQVWQAIERTVAAEANQKTPIPAFWTGWWQHGWAAAAACLLGWLLYAFWINHAGTANISRPAPVSENLSQTEATESGNFPGHSPEVLSASNKATASPANALELARLRRQVTELQNRVTHLSQSVIQQQAQLGETNRLKFFQLTPASSNNNGTAPPAALSPALQRALFLAMARELGWLPAADASLPAGNAISLPAQAGSGNVDFLDLRTPTNFVANAPQPPPNNQTSTQATTENSPAPNAAPIAIPAFTSGNNVVVAIDQSVVPSGTQLNFLNQNQQSLGTTTLGDNPLVVTIPTSANGSPVFITTGGGVIIPINVYSMPGSGATSQ